MHTCFHATKQLPPFVSFDSSQENDLQILLMHLNTHSGKLGESMCYMATADITDFAKIKRWPKGE